MPSNALVRLLNATRPYKEFSVEIGTDTVTFYARRPGAIESAQVSKAFDEAYKEAKREQSEPDLTSLYALLKRQEPKRLAEFIVKADNRDYLQEASMLNNDADLSDPKVIADAKEISETKFLEYSELSPDELLEKAWSRREHFQAVEDAQTAANYMMGVTTLFDKNDDGTFVPLFNSIEDAKSLPIDTLLKVLSEALKVIGEGTSDNPLKSAPSPSSDEPTQSLGEKAEVSPSLTSSGP